MAVRLTRAACPGRTQVRTRFACGRVIALLAVMALLACAQKEGAPPSPPASDTASAPGATRAAEPARADRQLDTAPSSTTTSEPGKSPPPPPPEPSTAPSEPGTAPSEPGTAPSESGTPLPAQGAKRPAQGTTRHTSGKSRPDTKPPRSSDQQAATATAPEPTPDPAPETAPDPAPEPAPEPDPRDDVEAFYAGLPEEAIAFHVPATVPRAKVFTVRLIVEPGKSEAEIERVLVEMVRDAGAGEVRTRKARVGDEMQARLSSPTLQIVVRGNDTQLVRRSGVTEWVWDVTANTGGTHRLVLTLYAIPQGRGSGLKVKTFEETLTVEVGFVDEIRETFSEHWEWMWTFVLGPVGALVWRKRRQRLAREP